MKKLGKWTAYALSAFFAILFISIISSAGYLNSMESVKKQQQAVTNQIMDINEDGKVMLSKNYNFTYSSGSSCVFIEKKTNEKCPDVIYVRANITAIDIQSSKFRMHLQFYPSGED